jgi:hypothetical protein
MIFGALAEEELGCLQKRRNEFLTAAAVGRGAQFQPWRNGEMQGVGSRMPTGGRKGDTYTVYPGMEIGDEIVQIKKQFKYAKVRNSKDFCGKALKKKNVFRILKWCSQRWRLTLLVW